jgi:acetyltransferase-like isoleucine patch superfamily enzyme
MIRIRNILTSLLGLTGVFFRVLRDWAACDPGALYEAHLRRLPGEGGQRRRRAYFAPRFGACGRELMLMHDVWIVAPENLRVGDNLSVAPGAMINAGGGVAIGDDVLIGPGTKIWSLNHAIDDLSLPVARQGYQLRAVQIGSDVWIGAGSIILPGVAVGDHVVIGAGSVVTHDLPAWCVAAGSPAGVIKHRCREPLTT